MKHSKSQALTEVKFSIEDAMDAWRQLQSMELEAQRREEIMRHEAELYGLASNTTRNWEHRHDA